MTQHLNGATATSADVDDDWKDSADYPHRIENHVKVYLHLEEASVDRRAAGGPRPDWDRQHQAAGALDFLPAAEELLPLLAAALGTSIDGPTVDQVRAAVDAALRALSVALRAGGPLRRRVCR